MKKLISVLAVVLVCTAFPVKAECIQKDPSETADHNEGISVEEILPEHDLDYKSAQNFKNQNLYAPYMSKITDENYEIKGTIYLSDKRGLAKVKAAEDTEVVIKGTITRVEGDMRILYEDPDGSMTVLVESQKDSEQPMTVDQAFNIKAGTGNLYFSSSSAIYDFDLKLKLSDEIHYYEN